MEEANIAIIGAGVVGLAIAAKLSEKNEGVHVLERNSQFGQETSSHNSGVIHSGIQDLKGSLKARLCVKGNKLVYEICEKYRIPHKRLGKLTVAIEEEEIKELERLKKQGEDNGVEGLRFLEKNDVRILEPNVEVEKALYSPSTGIVEPNELMNYFYARAYENGAMLAASTEVTSLRKIDDGYEVGGITAGEKFTVKARSIINCAGLFSDQIAAMPGLDVDKLGYRLLLCKGDYFRISGKPPVKMPIYPVRKGAGVDVHLIPDLTGVVRVGPNRYYVNKIDYKVESNVEQFREVVKRFLPSIGKYQLLPDSAGIRPLLRGRRFRRLLNMIGFKPREGLGDFLIRHESDKGLFGLIDLIGIESPGLTASPAIAEFISEMYEREIKR